MTPGQTYLLALGCIVVFLLGIWQFSRGWAQRAEAVERGRLERGEPVRRRLRSALDGRLRRTWLGRSVSARLVAAGVDVGVSDYLALTLLLTVASGAIGRALVGPVVGVLLALAAAAGCWRYLAFRQARRREEFVGQLPDLARVMSNASAAGLALPRAIEMAASELGPPATQVMQRVVEELRVGQSVDKALENLLDRVPSREVGVLVSTLVIQQRAGGDTVAALRDMAQTLEGRKDLRREVKTVMSGAITTGWAVAGVGVGSLFLVNAISPGLLEQMTRTGLGRIALLVTAGLYALAFTLIRRTTRIEA